MSKKLTPITLLCGYLGAGKTTLMNKILDKYNIVALDTGLLYRYVAKIIFDKIKDDIDINTLSDLFSGNNPEKSVIKYLILFTTGL